MRGLIFIFFILNSVVAIAATHVVGEYTPQQLSQLKIGCQTKEIKSVVLSPVRSEGCRDQIYIRQTEILYPGGFTQMFEYDGANGTPLIEAKYDLLPDTRCVQTIQAQLSVARGTDRTCQNQSKIRVSLVN